MDRIDDVTGQPAARRSGLPAAAYRPITHRRRTGERAEGMTWVGLRPDTRRHLGLRPVEGVARITWSPTGVATEA